MENELVPFSAIQHPKKRAFLAAFSECGTVTRAAEIIGIDRATHYIWMRDDPDYAKASKEAFEQAAERLEQEARRRAVEGTRKPVFYKGEECGTVTEYSDTLLIFLLKGALPEKYAERTHTDVTVAPGPSVGEYQTLRELKEMQAKQSKQTEIMDIEPIRGSDET